ncbi:ATP-dependent zinc metalloprotease FtsH [Bordetella avium]|uniref:ATP-dependent zinc metalloprotease FtsH n=1 Tax=Bordetella avium (strain 197N) TaxID=360910 RepID=Q2KVR2_BORA1|nr:ATP-dependent zinc metalloprotease FtsH [Bordetella avium]AZY48442.1 ATP-dependent metallopeptidase FtsH/Yme1/Tma family protein [Bordetella avium]AZY51821.1 ATP-dependent metallopeptidase FtsH/Yme1/Tma family protein [Bordetella avium]RIQ13314.1 ATP-dependent metallopeptidase FtsH/Yme1/Tma family protein [Bordetella avium]RIQ16432.1 ATP-dependent metallopeptidase FtsH/Yme1/Tma family protein [Bordetella avium]RIQ31118.1 ATP-dependent metallopeptidase FtsH/Yme1/Tma family protein [Bordetell
MNNSFSKVAVWMVIALVLFTVFKQFDGRAQSQDGVSYTQFMDDAKAGRIRKVDVQGDVLYVTPDTGRAYTLTSPGDLWMVSDLLKYGVQVSGKAREEPSLLMSIFVSWFPMLLLIGVWVFFMRQMQGGGRGGAFSFGKSRARMLDENTNQVTFADVAGCDEAKEDVQELVDFLRDPSKFQKLGGRIPRGVLMVGSPGTGKTLLARAIAGEAKVPFFSISGSDFVEMFVGVGAARVRDMFENAKKHAPCIIFIDEIDAVGRQRGAGLGGGNDEREQTLNQMLVEMDGFESGQGVIVIAATNRPDVLDPALLRPGRFDRQVVVPLPDIRGREQILKVHMRKVPLSPNVDATILARGTPGFSGADLANLVNEAALFAARRNGRTVDMSDFEKAKDKIIMGAERRSIVMPEEERRNTAYHESGHAIVARLLPKTDPVHKVTIIPRGRALGVTMQLPESDRYSMDKERLLNTIAVLFGGRIAEEVFMHQMTTGASNDFERATAIARDIVTRYGMTDELGPVVYAENEGEVFLGRSVTKTTHMSEATMQKVDNEIRRIIDEQYGVARKILEDNRDKVEVMTHALLEWETIDADQINDIIEGRPPRPPKTPHGGPSDTPDAPASGVAGNTAAAV